MPPSLVQPERHTVKCKECVNRQADLKLGNLCHNCAAHFGHFLAKKLHLFVPEHDTATLLAYVWAYEQVKQEGPIEIEATANMLEAQYDFRRRLIEHAMRVGPHSQVSENIRK